MLTGERPPPLHVVLEVARLAALRSYSVLDLDLPALNGFAELAARCVSRSMGAISFVDSDRIWFGASHGFTESEVPRLGSFCNVAIQSSGPTVVQDAFADSRFAVGGPGYARFYAGVPLEDGDGYRIGMICVFDPLPGHADATALAGLSRLAAMAMGTLTAYRETLPGFPQTAQPGPELVQGWLGVRSKSSGRANSNSPPGLVVISVAADSPAERGGLRPADLLIAIDGRPLRHSADVTTALANRSASGHARVQLVRSGQTVERLIPIEAERSVRPFTRSARAIAS